ncbi:unnamed protein product [Ilex paraguariensis]|uniref:Titin-like n=1 Tax=Ilex paraguariensis TaxID=185542 RepID=A0ABC8SL69_9AQUA
MASETAVSDHSTTLETVEKEVHEEVKTIEKESVSPPKQSGEEEKPKAEESPSPAVPLVAESEKKIENKPAELLVTEDGKKIDVAENPKAGDSPSPAVSLEPEEKIEDKQVEPSVMDDVRKIDEEGNPKAEDSPSPPVTWVASEEKNKDKGIEPSVIDELKKIDETPDVEFLVEPSAMDDVRKTDEEGKPKAEDSPNPPVTLVASEEKIEDKGIEPSVIDELKKIDETTDVEFPVELSVMDDERKTDEEGKPKAEDSPSPPVTLVASEEKIEDKGIEPSVIDELKKIDETTDVEFPVEPSVIDDERKTDEEEKPKAGDSPSPPVTLVASEEKIEDKGIEPFVIDDLKMIDETPDVEFPVEPSVMDDVRKTDEEGKPKAEDSPSPPVTLVASEEKIEDKGIEPAVIDELKKIDETPDVEFPVEPSVMDDVRKTDAEGKPKAEDSPSPPVTLVASEEKIEDEGIDPSVIDELKKIDETPDVECPVEEMSKLAKDCIPEPSILDVSEPVADNITCKPEKKPVIDTVEKQEVESIIKSAEEKPEEMPNIVDVPESSVEAVRKKGEQVEVLTVEESEAVAVEDVENSEAESKQERPEPIPKIEEESKQPSEVAEKLEEESVVIKAKESVEVQIAKDEVDDTKLKEEQITKEQTLVTETLTPVPLVIQEAQVNVKGGPTHVPEKGSLKDKEKELGGEAAVVEEQAEEEVVEGKFETDNEAKNVITEENGEKNVPTGELTQPEAKEVEDVTSSIPVTEATENSLEGENSRRDIELVAENGKENINNENVPSVKTKKDQDQLEEKADEVAKIPTKEQVEEPQKPEVEVKGEDSVQSGETKLEKEKEADETTREVSIPERTRDGHDMKISQDPPTEVASTKATQKQSNNIMAKVKQSLVKAKKAIIGKSPNSKMSSSETKGDVKAK